MGDGQLNRYTPFPTDSPDFRRHTIPIDPFEVSPHGSPYKCYHIQVDYIGIMLGLLDYYAHTDAFTGTPEQQERSVAFIEQLRLLLMTGNLSCGGEVEMRLRQSSTYDCVLEISYDGGVSWETAFDFAKCYTLSQAANDISIVNSNYQTQQQTQELISIYDGTPESVAPGMDYDGGPQDAFRDSAVCAALLRTTQLAAAASGTLLQSLESLSWDVNLKIARLREAFLMVAEKVATVATGDDDLTGKLLFWIAKKYAAEQTEYWETHKPTSFLGTFQQRRDIACYAFDGIQGYDFTFDAFRQMFIGVAGLEGVTTDDEIFLVDFTSSLEIYLTILDWLEEFNADLIAGTVDFSCPCGAWEHEITDFRDVPNSISRTFAEGAGGYSPGGTLLGDDDGPGDSIRLDWSFTMPSPFRMVDGEMYYKALVVSEEDSWFELRHGYQVLRYQQLPAMGVNKDVHWTHDSLHSVVVVRFDTGLTEGDIEITKLVLRGEGANPFL